MSVPIEKCEWIDMFSNLALVEDTTVWLLYNPAKVNKLVAIRVADSQSTFSSWYYTGEVR